MRQTLFYISLNAPWTIAPGGMEDRPLLHIGLGWILVIAIGVMAIWRLVIKRGESGKTFPQQMVQWLSASAQLAVIGLLAIWFSPIRWFPVFGYGAMLLVGFVAGASWAGVRAERVGIPRETIWDVAMLILFTGIVGARSFYLLQYGHRVFANVKTLPEFLMAAVNLSEGGLVLYGGVIMGTVAYFLFCSLRKIHPLQLADIITPSIFLGLGFGRLGCLLNGCCFGDRCDLPWAITFPEGSGPYEILVHYGFLLEGATASLPLHPTQIYSSLGGFVLAFVTAMVFKYRRKPGEVLAVGAILYPINRFLIEFVRGDEFTQFDTGLTISQLVSLGVLAAGVLFLIWLELFYRPRVSVRQAVDG